MADHTYNVLKAVYDSLRSDTDITNIVAASKITTGAALPNTSYPYIVLSRADSEAWDTKDVEGQMHYVQVNFYSRKGIKECAEIKEAIYENLHRNTSLTMPVGTSLIDIVHDNLDGIAFQEDGITVEGVLRFALTVQ